MKNNITDEYLKIIFEDDTVKPSPWAGKSVKTLINFTSVKYNQNKRHELLNNKVTAAVNKIPKSKNIAELIQNLEDYLDVIDDVLPDLGSDKAEKTQRQEAPTEDNKTVDVPPNRTASDRRTYSRRTKELKI